MFWYSACSDVVVDVERIRILHQELARAHHTEARADLVAELGWML